MPLINKDNYYTAKEAKKRLGDIHPNTLKRFVDSGKLTREFPPGRKQGLYSKKQVDDLARELEHYYIIGSDSSMEDKYVSSVVNSS